MSHLSLSFLRGFEVSLDAEPITTFGGDKVRALLAYLAIESDRPHRRAELSAMFWSDLPDSRAAHNLSQSLLRIRQALREKQNPSSPSFLLVTPQDVQFNAASDWDLDVARFRALFAMARHHHHADANRCEICCQWRLEAASLYQGDLLKGLFLSDSVKFEEWQMLNQEELRRQALEIFQWLTSYFEQRGDFGRTQEFARRQIALEPWREEAQLQLMRALAQSGQAPTALKQYEIYQQLLEKELGIQPSAETIAYYEQIRSREGANSSAPKPLAGEAAWLSNQGERRQVTALVCGHSSSGDSEKTEEQLSHCEQKCAAIFNRFGGKRAQRQGSTCLVYFGYPQAYEDAARRAVHSGLAVTAAFDQDKSIQIGIHTGLMTVGEKRGRRWQDRDLIGDIPDIARDCQRNAKLGQVIISDSTRRLVNEYFELQSLNAQLQITQSKSLPVFQARGEGTTQSRLEWLAQTQRLTTFMGREEELGYLRAAYETMLQGKGQVVLLRGEPGIGKSRLVWEFEHEGRIPALWLSGHSMPHDQNTTLYPIKELFDGLLGFHPDDSLDLRKEKLMARLTSYKMTRPATVWLLSTFLGLPTETPAAGEITKAQRDQIRELGITLLNKRAAEQPVVLVLEDMHWSDPSTLEWIGQSIDSIGNMRCLLLLTARPSFNPSWLSRKELPHNLQILSLKPLPPEQVQEMINDLASRDILEEETRQQIVTNTDGVPLFVEELTKTVLERLLFQTQMGNGSEIPFTLLDSLMARLDGIGSAKETAQWAAALGREFSYAILKACVPYEEEHLQSSLAQLIENELITPIDISSFNKTPTHYMFKHALVQEAAYSSMLKKTREIYHRRIAETMEARFPQLAETRPEFLAQHYLGAGLPTKAVDYWMRAGEHAIAQGATLEAKTFFDRILESIEPGDHERRWQALLQREHVFDLQAERDAQQQDMSALLGLAETFNDDARRAQIYLRQVSYNAVLGNYAATLPLAEAARAAAQRAGNSVLELRALIQQAQALLFSGDRGRAQNIVEESLARLPDVADNSVQALALTVAAHYYMEAGDLTRALQFQQQSAEAAQSVRNFALEASINANLGMLYAEIGLYAQAHAAIKIGMERTELIGDRWLHASALRHLGFVYWHEGERDLARELIEESLAELDVTGDTYGKASCFAYLGYLLEEDGRNEQAAEYLEKARLAFAEIGLEPDKFESQAVQAHTLLILGQYEKARELTVEVCNYLRENGTEGLSSPSLIYVSVAKILSAIEIPNVSLRETINAGYHNLMKRAEKISNPEWSRSFLENIAENKAIVERWKELNEAASLV